ncbi:MAG: hypothetical protein ACRCZF_26250 [Gemmataceae bacterium]
MKNLLGLGEIMTQSTLQNPFTLESLLERFLNSEAVECSELGGVVPHDLGVGFRATVTDSWKDASWVVSQLGGTPSKAPIGGWAQLTLDAPRPLCMAWGHAPQLLRDLLMPFPHRTLAGQQLQAIGSSTTDQMLSEGLNLRLRSEPATDALERKLSDRLPQAVAQNELGAIAYAAGDTESARGHWNQLPQSPVRDFNLAVLALAEATADAECQLQAAAAQLPEGSAWRHYAELLLATEFGAV